MVYLHPQSLSPDPTYGRQTRPLGEGWFGLDVYPHAVAWCRPGGGDVQGWGTNLHLSQAPPPLTLQVPSGDDLDLVLDFGTELEGALHLEIESADAGALAIAFGESLWEAREWGPPSSCAGQRPRKQLWHIDHAGTHTRTFEEGGFRFVRLRLVDFARPLRLRRILVQARFAFDKRLGDFECSDKLFQRIWQSSVYTARLCSRPDSLWDGIKRDRHGWYGDARITKQAIDLVYHDPAPSIAMMLQLPTDSWANGIPGFSFDCLAMLRQHILSFGLDTPHARDVYARIQQLLAWTFATHVGPDGMLRRCDGVSYFFGIGFTDWSPQPLGGRFEELAPLQFAWLEALRNAQQLAHWFDDGASADRYRHAADQLAPRLREAFWDPQRGGFHHTLNQADPPGTPWRMPTEPDTHYRKTYIDGLRHGPSGPSLQANARAVFAGVCDDSQTTALRTSVFANPAIAPIITSYYQYYVNHARAACGDVSGALTVLRDYFGSMLQENDSPTIWESFEPKVRGIRRWSLHQWPKSLCHGWGSGTVPITGRFLLGVEPLTPGMSRIAISPAPATAVPWSFRATIPTPHGPIRITRERPTGDTEYRLPRAIHSILPPDRPDVRVVVDR